MTFDGKAFGKDIVETVKGHIDKTVAPLLAEIASLKAEVAILKAMPAPKDGKDADPSAVAAVVAADIRKDIDALRSSVEALPKKAPELPDIPAMIAQAVKAAVPQPSVIMDLVLEAIPLPKDGKDGSPGAKGDPGEVGPAGKSGSDGLNGKDGVSLAGAMIDRKGVLILTLSDGTTRELGHVVGKDVDMITVEGMVDKATHKAIAEAWAAIPEPKDGEAGPQGEPGKSITVEDVAPLIETAVAKHVESIERMVPDVVKSAVSSIKVPEAPKLPDIPALVEAAVKALPPAQDGKDADPALVASTAKEAAERAVAALPMPKDGRSVTLDDVRPLIEEAVTKAVTLIPVPKDGEPGASVTLDDVAPMIKAEVDRVGAEIIESATSTIERTMAAMPPAPAGKDADPEIIKQMVTEAVAALPPAEKGKDGVTIEELRPVIDETVSKAISAIPVPKDGKDGLDAVKFLRGDKGNLIVTMSNGTVEDLGEIDGKDANMEAIERSIAEKVAAIPIPKDGVDGIGFDDVTEELEDEGRIIVRRFFNNGAIIKESRITTKMSIFRGVHDHTRTYLPGDQVTRGGSVWHCDVECSGPFNGDFWTLSAKKGRDAPKAD